MKTTDTVFIQVISHKHGGALCYLTLTYFVNEQGTTVVYFDVAQDIMGATAVRLDDVVRMRRALEAARTDIQFRTVVMLENQEPKIKGSPKSDTRIDF